MDTMNALAEVTILNIEKDTGLKAIDLPSYISKHSIGIEIEVKWRDYFPDLWEKYILGYDQVLLNAECSTRETTLLPRLQKTIEYGIPKGKDLYWEFAFNPVTNPNLLVKKVDLLKRMDLIPKGNHSLHLTIAGIPNDRNAVYLLMALEAYASSAERILSGYHKTLNTSAGWAKKGYAGTFTKESKELINGATTAVEFRILELREDVNLEQLLLIASHLSAAYKSDEWKMYCSSIESILTKYHLPNCNWKKPHLNSEIWKRFIDNYSSISFEIRSEVERIWSHLFKDNVTIKKIKSPKPVPI